MRRTNDYFCVPLWKTVVSNSIVSDPTVLRTGSVLGSKTFSGAKLPTPILKVLLNLKSANYGYESLLTVCEVQASSDVVMHNAEDQRENDRRERESNRIASLKPADQQLAKDLEAALQQQYNNRVFRDTGPSNTGALELNEQSFSSVGAVQLDPYGSTMSRACSPARSTKDKKRWGYIAPRRPGTKRITCLRARTLLKTYSWVEQSENHTPRLRTVRLPTGLSLERRVSYPSARYWLVY